MELSVRYFAVLRERKGCSVEVVDVPDGLTVRGVYRHLFVPADVPVAFVLNREVVPEGAHPRAGDELAFLPPVGGG